MQNTSASVIRMALFTSLGLVPLGCAGRSADSGEGTTRDLGSAGAGGTKGNSPPGDPLETGGTGSDPSNPAGGSGGGTGAPLPSCGESTPVLNEQMARRVTGVAPVLEQGIETGVYRCDNGVIHRPEQVSCASGLPRATPPAIDAGADAGVGDLTQIEFLYGDWTEGWVMQCTADADCTERPNGYCAPTIYGGIGPQAAVCNYGCLTDDDCGSGFLCECGDPVGQCVAATCRSDADCPGDLLCAAWFTANVCGVGKSFTCQTSEDECNTVADCPDPSYGTYCGGQSGSRECLENNSVCGRPFLVRGDARVAASVSSVDWCSGDIVDPAHGPSGPTLSPEQRRYVGERWCEMALMEHASIAAFARFTLQLLHVGAPRELIERSQQAMLDETLHTKACFELASSYLEAPTGPGRLPMDAALQETELVEIVVNTFREGCVGETVATLEAKVAGAFATSGNVRRALSRIAEDELRHSELAWRFVSWALATHGSKVGRAIEEEVRRLELELAQPLPTATSRSGVPAYGILSDVNRSQLRRAAIDEIVLPCVAALTGQASVEHSLTSGRRVTPARTAADA